MPTSMQIKGYQLCHKLPHPIKALLAQNVLLNLHLPSKQEKVKQPCMFVAI